MTEPTDPTGPTEPRNSDHAAERAWFRSQVDPVVEAEPVADAWHLIEGRTSGDTPAPAPVAAGRATRTRWLAAAAVLLVLAGATVVVALREDDATSVTTEPPEATGWYIPKGLPDGWSLQSVVLDDQICNGTAMTWEGEDPDGGGGQQGASLELEFDPCATLPAPSEGDRAPGPALGPSIESSDLESFMSNPSSSRIRWYDDGLWSLRGRSMTEDEVIDAAKVIVAGPASEADVAGLEIKTIDNTGGSLARRQVRVELAAPDGNLVRYELVDGALVPEATPFATDTPAVVEGQPLAMIAREPTWGGLKSEPTCCTSGSRFVGRWPGALVDVARMPEFVPLRVPSDQDRRTGQSQTTTLASSLRPATTAEWRAFLDTASEQPVDDRLTTAATLLDALGSPTKHTSDTATTMADRGTSTTQQLATTTSAAPNGDEPAPGTSDPIPDGHTSPVATEVPNDVPSQDDSELRGLELRINVASTELGAGSELPITLLARNTTSEAIELGECTVRNTRWGLVPRDDSGIQLPEASGDHCTSLPKHTIRAGESVEIPLDWGRPSGFLGQTPSPDGTGRFLGTLPAGDYLATVQMPGRSFDAVMAIPVTLGQPACPTDNSEVEPYLGISEDDARAVAQEQGRSVRVVRIDGVPQARTDDLRCDRINLDVDQGTVTNAVAY